MTVYNINDAASFLSAMASIEKKLTINVAEMNANVTRAVADCALSCLENAVERAPVESGDLRSSGYVDINNRAYLSVDATPASTTIRPVGPLPPPSPVVSAEVGFAAVYAHRQHEDMNARHDRTDGYKRADGSTVNMVAGGQSKYLESVVVENIRKWAAHIKAAASKALGG